MIIQTIVKRDDGTVLYMSNMLITEPNTRTRLDIPVGLVDGDMVLRSMSLDAVAENYKIEEDRRGERLEETRELCGARLDVCICNLESGHRKPHVCGCGRHYH